jgi:hypothetical protein
MELLDLPTLWQERLDHCPWNYYVLVRTIFAHLVAVEDGPLFLGILGTGVDIFAHFVAGEVGRLSM